ncbi:hypothetical protein SDRG_03216 [Saprolegnia diclina VS20]|uniref:Uncharacterized protein n=1 Tax=Saprolegnia diclina (strain VS20) TaxID=1156394 RepID=T0S3X9_SAPDV|nr:hypothetical protein SDRG_03216 [Saprolegnia diclina VS20]EQC39793.1 hypothetical protein SDRG_03216 [Saprolegnia diclina VS20]|eukprot:XP_008607065.1 hypothetical protein SDRG_03216 [Saprolegnia diclina VS20]
MLGAFLEDIRSQHAWRDAQDELFRDQSKLRDASDMKDVAAYRAANLKRRMDQSAAWRTLWPNQGPTQQPPPPPSPST